MHPVCGGAQCGAGEGNDQKGVGAAQAEVEAEQTAVGRSADEPAGARRRSKRPGGRRPTCRAPAGRAGGTSSHDGRKDSETNALVKCKNPIDILLGSLADKALSGFRIMRYTYPSV